MHLLFGRICENTLVFLRQAYFLRAVGKARNLIGHVCSDSWAHELLGYFLTSSAAALSLAAGVGAALIALSNVCSPDEIFG